MTDVVRREKATEECPPSFQVAQFALDLLSNEQQAQLASHFETCQHCASLLREHRQGMEAAKLERVPEALRQATEAAQRRWFRLPAWVAASSMAAAVAVALLVVLRTPVSQPAIPQTQAPAPTQAPPQSQVRSKGSLRLSVAWKRNGEMLESAAELTSIKDQLQVGDQLRLRIDGVAGGFAWVQAKEQGSWIELYRGSSTRQWLPFALTITAGEQTQLRLTHCPKEEDLQKAPSSLGCQVRSYWLGRP